MTPVQELWSLNIFVEGPCSYCSSLWSHVPASGGICCNRGECIGVSGGHRWELQILVRAESEGASWATGEFPADV